MCEARRSRSRNTINDRMSNVMNAAGRTRLPRASVIFDYGNAGACASLQERSALPPLWTGLFCLNAAEVGPEIGSHEPYRGPPCNCLAMARGFAASATSQEAFSSSRVGPYAISEIRNTTRIQLDRDHFANQRPTRTAASRDGLTSPSIT
jgi:hypothetical protein